MIEGFTKWMIPAAVNQTEMKMETNCARRMELDVLRMLRYCRISGTVINLKARRKRRPNRQFQPVIIISTFNCRLIDVIPIHVRSKQMDTNDGGIVKQSTNEYISNMNHNLSLAAMNCTIEPHNAIILKFYFHRDRRQTTGDDLL